MALSIYCGQGKQPAGPNIVGNQAFLIALLGHPLVKITSPKVNNELLGHVGETLIDELSIPVQFYGLPSTNNDIPQITQFRLLLSLI